MNRLFTLTSCLLLAGISHADGLKFVKNPQHGIVCSRQGDKFGYFGWPSIARQADGTLAVVASGPRYAHVCPWGKTTLITSKDNGETWSLPRVITNSPIDDRDAGIVALGGQRLAVTWFADNTMFDVKQFRDKDGNWDASHRAMGAVLNTWTPELIAKYSGSWIRVSEDGEYWSEPRRAPVNTPHGFIVLKNGDWLYFGKEWAFPPFTDVTVYRLHDTPIIAVRSRDEGRTWERLGTVPTPNRQFDDLCHEPHVVELENGELLGAIRVHKPFNIYFTRSKDGGRTWSEPEDSGVLGSPPHLLRHSSGAIVCAYGYRKEPFGERCMISYDNGKTWEKDIVIFNDAPNPDLGYPASCELPDGSIITVYYQKPDAQSRCSILYSKWQLPDRE